MHVRHAVFRYNNKVFIGVAATSDSFKLKKVEIHIKTQRYNNLTNNSIMVNVANI